MTPPNTHIFIVVEGQSEKEFINTVIKPTFESNQIYIFPKILGRNNHKGGHVQFDRFKRDVVSLIKQIDKQNNFFVTTMFDFYGLEDFPVQDIEQVNNIYKKAEYIEKIMLDTVLQTTQCHPERFIPYIQLYELEGLFFSDVEKLCSIQPNWYKFISQLQNIRNDFETPEHINNSFDTKPSKRLENVLFSPKYNSKTKTLLSPIIW